MHAMCQGHTKGWQQLQGLSEWGWCQCWGENRVNFSLSHFACYTNRCKSWQDALLTMTPAMSLDKHKVDGYIKVGPNWWARCNDIRYEAGVMGQWYRLWQGCDVVVFVWGCAPLCESPLELGTIFSLHMFGLFVVYKTFTWDPWDSKLSLFSLLGLIHT